MSYKAPPGSWRQFLALIVGVVLLVILAPSGTSASTSRRTRRVVFSAKNIGEHGISSSSQTRNNHNNDGGSNDTNDSSSSNSAIASNYKESEKKKLYTNKSIDPSKWKRLNAPHSIIKSELIGDRIESSALNPSTLKDQEKSQNDVKLRTEDDDAPLSSIHQGIKQSTEEDEQNSSDQWYVLNNVQSKKDVSYELKVMFPLETPVNVDLDVSVWTLVGAQAQIMDKIRLADHYSEIPISETTDAEIEINHRDSEDDHRNNLAIARSQKSPVNNTSASGNRIIGGASASNSPSNSKGKDHRGYAALNHNDDEDDDEFEDAAEDSVMLRPLASSSASGSAPRRPVYPSNANDDDDDDDNDDNNEISVAMPEEGSSSSAASSSSSPNGKSISAVLAAKKNSGARTTNMSFLARLTGRQRPERDAQRMVRSAVDGVFSNLSAKPRVEKPFEEELPPAYKTAALDVSPAYHETMLPPGFTDDDDMLLVEGLPVGGLFGFVWNMIISMTFQFVGFFLTYLLHTSHSTKQGSKTGLGITFISMGYRMMNGKLPEEESEYDEDSDTGYMGNTGKSNNIAMGVDYDWLSYLMLMVGVVIVIHSVSSFTRVKLSEIRVAMAANAAREETISGSSAAGVSGSERPLPGNDGAIIVAMLS
ncbi:Nedd4 interacting protein [Haplosporangium sp. Z 27]|nr:Nedd4 interacting protein [Haplosporangium sp. Z 27]